MSESDRRPWLRFSLRTLLAAVLVIGLWLATAMHARQRATLHAALANNYGYVAAAAQHNQPVNNFVIDQAPSARNRATQARYEALYWHHQRLSEKYQRAVWRPWVLFEFDPPEPAQDAPPTPAGPKT